MSMTRHFSSTSPSDPTPSRRSNQGWLVTICSKCLWRMGMSLFSTVSAIRRRDSTHRVDRSVSMRWPTIDSCRKTDTMRVGSELKRSETESTMRSCSIGSRFPTSLPQYMPKWGPETAAIAGSWSACSLTSGLVAKARVRGTRLTHFRQGWGEAQVKPWQNSRSIRATTRF